jgi:hypothetical protein
MGVRRKRSGLWRVGFALLIMIVTTQAAGAQGLFGPGQAGAPFPGGSCGGIDGRYGKSCPGGLKLEAGYLWGPRGLTFGASAPIGSFVSRYPVQGAQIGATLQGPLKGDFGVILRGTWLFPSNERVFIDTQLAGGVSASVNWATQVQYYTLDGAGVYPFCAGSNVLVGFRFDSLAINLRDPSAEPLFFAVHPSLEAETTVYGYIPYVGLAVNSGRARASLIGTPIFWGDFRFRRTDNLARSQEIKHNLKNPYFLEASAEYDLPAGPGTLAVSAKWTYMHSAGEPNFEIQTPSGALFVSAPVTTSLIRQNAYIGATFSVALPSPF